MNSNNQTRKLRTFLSYYKPYKGLLIADLLCSALVAAIALVFPMCVRYITNELLASGISNVTTEIFRVGALMVALIVLQTATAMFYDYKGHDMGAKIERDMRLQLFTKYQQFSFSFYDNQSIGQLMSRLTNDLLNLTELFHHGPENLVVYGSQFIGSLIILMHMNAKLTLVICAWLPLMAVYSFIFYRKLQTEYAKNRQRIADVNTLAEENLSGNRIVKSFTNETFEVEKFTRANNCFYRGRARTYQHEALHSTVISNFFARMITVIIVVFGGIWIADATLNVADLLVFILYSQYLIGPIPSLAFMVQQYQEGLSGYRRFREMIEMKPEIQDIPGAIDLPPVTGRVELKNVTFRYQEDQAYVLRGINLDVSPGETVAIVGSSGGGKTTLCSMIPRFYEVGGGEIRIDGINIRDVTLHSLRRQIGVVQQDQFLFAGTIMDNILYGKPDASADEAIEAAKRAHAHEFIMELPNGYHTQIGQRGVKLSGGQKQRICIARVFLKNPPILIFDEATSALDYESENSVMRSLHALSQGRTTFMIAHRLSTVRNAGRIVVLSENGVAEQGTHEQLLANGGVYAQLYHAQ